ncbi:MAG TPA: MgtC/SapB family protein [Rhizomicrobium sp.]|jgi:putative Mg2+ transporter-C (MgtC) family protein
MPLHPGWDDLAIRLILTLAAGALIGFNREEGGHAAGLRTNILVCLAASVSMILANLLTDSTGKAPDSFVVFDLMRFPLGILSGMGFIGAGAILRRGDLITGVTTAATLWFVTIVGLCFGGGQIYIGMAATLIGSAVLWLLKGVDQRIPREQHARLTVVYSDNVSLESVLAEEPLLAPLNRRLLSEQRMQDAPTEALYELRWQASGRAPPQVDFVQGLLRREGILAVEWRAGDAPEGESKGTDATKLRPNWLKT